MGPAAITLLMLVAFAGFGWLAWRKLAIVRALQPEARLDQPWQRLRSVSRQRPAAEPHGAPRVAAGIMHAVIFLGFMSLLLRKLQLIAIGYHESASFPNAFGGPSRRSRMRSSWPSSPRCCTRSTGASSLRPPRLGRNREAVLVLSLILAIMVTDFAFDAFRFALLAERFPAIAHERDFAFVGSALAAAVSAMSPAALQVGYVLAYWTQMVVVFSFLVLLPAGEHFHIVTALPALYFRRGRPGTPGAGGRRREADGGDRRGRHAGRRAHARDLTWKDGLDAFTCTECGRCKDACPTHLTGKPLSLKGVNDRLKHHLLEQRER